MIQRYSAFRTIRTGIMSVMVLALSGVILAGAASRELVHRQGRVAISLPENGSLSIRLIDDSRRGIVWPRRGGAEFLGSGGFYLRCRTIEEPSPVSISPVSFEATGEDHLARPLFEGCEGGKRWLNRGGDDDGDGILDEDPLDGEDNDRDGLIDEDFAAVGDGMVVTRAREPKTGLILHQSSYVWNYGHVRNFVGFTTELIFPEAEKERGRSLHDVSIALYVDFDIGDPDNEQRGLDDRFFVIGCIDDSGDQRESRELPVASDRPPSEYFTTVVIFKAAGQSNTALGTEGFIIGKLDCADSLWSFLEREQKRSRGLFLERRDKAVDDAPLPALDSNTAGEGDGIVDGDRAILYSMGTIPLLSPGDDITIEWALVFGRTMEALAANVRRAIETYHGITDEGGASCRWVVPARRAVRREFDITLASIWSGGTRHPAAALAIPAELEAEELEWLRVDGSLTTVFERMGGKIVLPLEREQMLRAEPLVIEGQLTDGTIFTASAGGELLQAYGEIGDLPPDRLPEESMQMFPNPFLTSLTIDVTVPGPSAFVNGTGRDLEGASSVRIYDVKGRLVRTILDEEHLHPGSYQMGWDGLDQNSAKVAPGVYYCKLQIGARSLTKRVILLR
jgi:hypothetical protein